MKYLSLTAIIFWLIIIGCSQKGGSKASFNNKIEDIKSIENSNDKDEIQNLIRQALTWANAEKSFDLLPAISDNNDSIYIGFDLKKLKVNLDTLKATNFFSNEFINNFYQIILTLDKKLKNHEYYVWLVGELPPFNFSNDVNPWCYCQEIPYDDPNPWGLVEINVLKLDTNKGELTWTWGKTDWPDILYRFNVTKEEGKWKISYMKGFDYNESIKQI
jgi:hypothetical protein